MVASKSQITHSIIGADDEFHCRSPTQTVHQSTSLRVLHNTRTYLVNYYINSTVSRMAVGASVRSHLGIALFTRSCALTHNSQGGNYLSPLP